MTRKKYKSLWKRRKITQSKFNKDISHDETCRYLYPDCMHLLKLPLMFLLRVACVERLFSKMKLIKSRLRNQVGETTLDSLFRILTETPPGFHDDKHKYFVDELKRLNPQMRINL